MTRPNAFPGPDDIFRAELPNGIIVLARENFASKSAVIGGTLQLGSLHDPQPGLASFSTAALMRGTHSRSFDVLHSALENIGASLNISGGTHTSSFSGKALAEDLPTLLALLSDALRHPAFPEDQCERLRAELLTGLRIQQKSTRSVAAEAFRQLAYPNHPYGQGSAALLESLPTITLAQAAAFHQRHAGPRGMVIAIVGAVTVADAFKLVSDSLGDWVNPAQPPKAELPALAPQGEIRREHRVLAGKTQTDIVLGWPGPSRFVNEWYAVSLCNSILGQFGMMGRLGHSVREAQGLAYYASSRVGGGLGPNPWNMTAGVSPQNVQQAVESILAEISRITTELVDEAELEDNKANFIGRLPLGLESNEGVAGTILSMETYGLGLDYLQRYRELVSSVTREQILTVAQQYLRPEAYTVGSAGPQQVG